MSWLTNDTCPVCSDPLSGDVIASHYMAWMLCHVECHHRIGKPFSDALARAMDEEFQSKRDYWVCPTA